MPIQINHPLGTDMEPTLTDHPIIKALQSEVERLKRRVDGLEYIHREDHDKLEKLEHEQEHDHELIERLEHPAPASPYTGRHTIAVGL